MLSEGKLCNLLPNIQTFFNSITNGYNGGHPNNLLWTKRVNVQTFTREDAELLMLRASENEPSYIETVDLIGPITNSALQVFN